MVDIWFLHVLGEEPSDFRTGQQILNIITNLQQPAVFARYLQAEQGS